MIPSYYTVHKGPSGHIWPLNPRDTPPTHHRLISIKTLIPGSRRVSRAAAGPPLRNFLHQRASNQHAPMCCFGDIVSVNKIWHQFCIFLVMFADRIRGRGIGPKSVGNGEFNPRPYLCYESIFSLLAKGKNGDGKQRWGRKVEFISDTGRVICVL